MKYLLDTHVLLWLLGNPSKVPHDVQKRLGDPENTLLASAVSAMEIATRTRLGKLDDFGLLSAWERRMSDMGVTELPLTSSAAVRAGSLPWPHRDPFDRMLVAQAVEEAATLVSVDQAFRGLTAPSVLTW